MENLNPAVLIGCSVIDCDEVLGDSLRGVIVNVVQGPWGGFAVQYTFHTEDERQMDNLATLCQRVVEGKIRFIRN